MKIEMEMENKNENRKYNWKVKKVTLYSENKLEIAEKETILSSDLSQMILLHL